MMGSISPVADQQNQTLWPVLKLILAQFSDMSGMRPTQKAVKVGRLPYIQPGFAHCVRPGIR